MDYELFDRFLLANNVNRAIFSPASQVIPLSFLRQTENKNHLEDKVGVVLLLNATMGGQNKNLYLTSYSTSNQKKLKTSQTIQSYNRYFLFADLTNPPFCAVIITRTVQESAFLLSENVGNTFIGSPYAINEPPQTNQTINGTNTIVLPPSDLVLYPLRPIADIAVQDTEASMSYPREIGEYQYYILKHKTISLHRIQLASNTSCTGIECDRQKKRGECTCLHSSSSHNFVYQFDVEFPIPLRMQRDSARTWTTPSFRSLRTTELFFRDFEAHASQTTIEDENALRQEHRIIMHRMVDYINRTGGWTIIGWYMLGTLTDANSSNTPENKIENYEMTIHINYLYPTAYHTRLHDDAEFHRQKIGAAQLVNQPQMPYQSDDDDDSDSDHENNNANPNNN